MKVTAQFSPVLWLNLIRYPVIVQQQIVLQNGLQFAHRQLQEQSQCEIYCLTHQLVEKAETPPLFQQDWER